MQKYKGFTFLAPLVSDMLKKDASKRPVAAEVVRRFDALRESMTEKQLRARLVPPYEGHILGLCRGIRHAFRTMRYKRQDKDAVPLPPDLL